MWFLEVLLESFGSSPANASGGRSLLGLVLASVAVFTALALLA